MSMTVSISAVSTGANAKSADQLNGTDLQNAPFNGILRVATKCSATGLNNTLTAGGIILINDQPIPFTGTAGTLSTQDNVVISGVFVPAGAKIQAFFRNTTGGALTADAVYIFDPV